MVEDFVKALLASGGFDAWHIVLGALLICLGWMFLKQSSAKDAAAATHNEVSMQAALAMQALVEQVRQINESLTEVRQRVSENAETAKRVELLQRERQH